MSDSFAALRALLVEMEKIPFPPSSTDQALAEIHAELAEYDGYLMGIVETVLESHKSYAQAVEGLAPLRQKLNRFKNKETISTQYLNYLDHLEKILTFASEAKLIRLK